MLQLNHIKKLYDGVEILADIDYTFDEGVIYPILGGKASGKTTLLRCICQECAVDGGSVRIRSKQPAFYAAKESVLPEYLTGEEFVSFLCGMKKGAKKPEEYLDYVEFDESMRRKVIRDYSFEDKKRLQLAAYLIQKPYIVVFDEPLDDCSESFADTFLGILSEECDRHIVLITTSKLSVARYISDDILMLTNGELNQLSDEMLDVPEIKQAISDILGDEDNDNY